jgi:hypothetical protein
MEIGIDSFASAMYGSNALSSADAMEQLLDRIVRADEAGLDVFGIGEHHKKEFLDSAPAVILSAAAARTKQIRLLSAVKVLSTDDPVRVYQSFATLDLISKGRAELVVGRGSAIEAFPFLGLTSKTMMRSLQRNWIYCSRYATRSLLPGQGSSGRLSITNLFTQGHCRKNYRFGWG